MSTEENKAIVRRVVEEGWNQGNPAIADELLAQNFLAHSPAGGGYGWEEWKHVVPSHHQTFPDYHLTIEDMIAEGEKVVWRWTMQGTNLGGFEGHPPNGKRVTMYGINIERLVDGKIVETWSSSDPMPLLRTLGVSPEENSFEG